MSKKMYSVPPVRGETEPEPQPPVLNNKQGSNRRTNKEMAVVTYIFIALFMFLSVYVLYFVIHDSDRVLNNPANKRSEIWAKHVTRGEILSADGKVLAETQTSDDGNETRVYPYGSLFVHVVGRNSHGATGLESSENYELLNTNLNPVDKVINEFNGKKSPGNRVVTTLDVSLSQAASEALGSRRGAVVAMEPETGKIVTMVSRPGYDPNDLTDERWEALSSNTDEDSPLYNRATQGLYPPGSTFKMYTALAFIRQNADYEDFRYKCRGRIGTDDGTIRCYGGEVHGKVDLYHAFAESCNTAFCSIGEKLNVAGWRNLCESMYFNKTIPFDKLEKRNSKFELTSSTSKGDVMQAAIGQGDVLVTPLQNILLSAAVANDGVLMQPYVVDSITSFDGKILSQTSPQELGRPVAPAEVKVMTKLMRGTVQYGTATSLYYGTPYKAAGKTGSAEFKAGSSESHAWFTGYVKYKNKSLAISVLVEGGGTGGAVAVPIAKRVFDVWADKLE
ncbi:MAG: penicillin-binding protein 2 [Eubacterium sp.]|nr:penicillin-binding protein 2 [Eubacterium sp.]